MALKFAFNWDKDWEKGPGAKIKLNGQVFTDMDARRIIRDAFAKSEAMGLKAEIDTGLARVINGPHKTKELGKDTRLHITINCKNMRQNFHIYISGQGNYSGSSQEFIGGIAGKTGNPKDDWNANGVDNSNQL